MKANFLLLVASFLASSNAVSKMTPCQTDCEKNYKYCVSSGKGSERACFATLEKCRNDCFKADK